jgi:cullin-associated NEDD8-dissociated protein 1
VAENLGRLYIYCSPQISSELSKSFKSASVNERATVVKSFKFGASKETSENDIQMNLASLIPAVQDPDTIVRRFALESLTAITHSQPRAMKESTHHIQKAATAMTVIDPTLIKEVDLGPFKHKVDEGIPIRRAAFSLIDTMIEKVPERVDASASTEIAIKGLEDTAEECMIQSLSILHRLVQWSPIIVVSQIDPLLD